MGDINIHDSSLMRKGLPQSYYIKYVNILPILVKQFLTYLQIILDKEPNIL